MVTTRRSKQGLSLTSLFQSLPWLALLLYVAPAMAQIEARIDRQNIAVGETFQLIISQPLNASSGQFNLNVQRPSHQPLLSDFQVLGVNNSSRVVNNGGSSSGVVEWIYTLQAKRSGKLTIPSLKVGQGRSSQIAVTVQPARQLNRQGNQPLFAKTELSTTTPYVQQQVLYTVRVFINGRLGLSNYTMSQPDGALVQPFGDETSYRTEIDGEAFDVVERQWLVFPQKSGKLQLEPPEFIAEFGGSSLFSRRSQQRLNIDSSQLTVKAKPASYTGALWLPAEQLTLNATLSPPADSEAGYQVGEPITYTVAVTALGLSAPQLPEPEVPELQNARVYPEDTTDKQGQQNGSLIGQRQRRIAIVPSAAGTLALPANELTWWNTDTDQQETAQLQPFNIQISGTAATPIADLPVPNIEPTVIPDEKHWTENRLWFYLFLLLAILWFIALGVIFIRAIIKRRNAREQAWLNRDNRVENEAVNKSTRWRALRSALEGKEFAATREDGVSKQQAAATALALWSKAKWPTEHSHNAIAVAERLDPQQQQPELHRQLGLLDKSQYGGAANSEWNGKATWQALEAAEKTANPNEKDQKNSAALPDLYA